uniref:Dual specificity protein kinase splB-like n=1 Tax=Dermatophagoides pteronyssinus TaxID=6956 RepID=A0A6P6YJR8_DERPT|nr:dual specificity protein kinase splB-like [Dermatophagoides pteronyssinus]
MPFFRCPLPKFDAPKPSFRFDSNSLPNYFRILSNDEKPQEQQQQENECSNGEQKSEKVSDQIISTQCYWQKIILNQRCPIFRYHENWSKIKILDENGSDRKTDSNQTKHRFDFNSLNIRLLETFGFIGTALIVGFDIRSRINQWSPAQHHRDHPHILHHPHNHHHHYHQSEHISYDDNNNPRQQQQTLPNVVDFYRSKTLYYFGSCRFCCYVFDKICTIPSFFPLSSLSSNIVEETTANLTIKTNHNDDEVHEPTNSITKSSSTTINTDEELLLDNIEEIEQILYCSQSELLNGHFLLNDNDNVNRKSAKKDKDNIITEQQQQQQQNDLSLICEKASGTVNVSSENNYNSDDNDDDDDEDDDEWMTNNDNISSNNIFRQTCIEYADILNNLSGIKLIKNQHTQNDALACWLSCDKRYSAALFNLGVAYENGLFNNVVGGGGDGSKKPDMDMAFHYYALAANKGHPNAIYNIALYYLYGKGNIKTNINYALQLLRIASDHGVKQAQDYCQQFNMKKKKLITIKQKSIEFQHSISNI